MDLLGHSLGMDVPSCHRHGLICRLLICDLSLQYPHDAFILANGLSGVVSGVAPFVL